MLEELKALLERHNALTAEGKVLDTEYNALPAPRHIPERGREIKRRIYEIYGYEGSPGGLDYIKQEIADLVITNQVEIVSVLEK